VCMCTMSNRRDRIRRAMRAIATGLHSKRMVMGWQVSPAAAAR
jgi:hypothetical protein